jgi:glycine C-acetyltransferase
MTGALGIVDKIVALKQKYQFRLMIDDAHGFGIMGEHGRGTSEHFNCIDGVDLYIGAFAKAMASIGGFVAGPHAIINYLRFNMRSQMYAKALPMPLVIGGMKRLEIIDSPEGAVRRKQLFTITRALQKGFRKEGFDIGPAEACVSPVAVKGGVAQATKIVKELREDYKIFCSMVIYPVIPKGMIIFRIIATSAHTLDDVNYTLKVFKEIRDKLDRGYYDGEDIAAMTIR